MNTKWKIKLVCGNCGKVRGFDSWDQAFQMGWDTVERFGYNACEQCPGVSVYFPMYYAQQARELPFDAPERVELLNKAADATVHREWPSFPAHPDDEAHKID